MYCPCMCLAIVALPLKVLQTRTFCRMVVSQSLERIGLSLLVDIDRPITSRRAAACTQNRNMANGWSTYESDQSDDELTHRAAAAPRPLSMIFVLAYLHSGTPSGHGHERANYHPWFRCSQARQGGNDSLLR